MSCDCNDIMRVTIQLPDDISAALEEQWDDVPRRSLEAIAAEGLSNRALTESQVRRLLGVESRFHVHFADLRSVTRSLTLAAPISATRALAEIAEDLVRGVLADHRDERTISLLAIPVSHLEAHAIVQLELPPGACRRRMPPRHKAGPGAIARRPGPRCDLQALRRTSGGLWGASRVGRSVPDEFGRVAEREL
jgi:DNA polymerase-4